MELGVGQLWHKLRLIGYGNFVLDKDSISHQWHKDGLSNKWEENNGWKYRKRTIEGFIWYFSEFTVFLAIAKDNMVIKHGSLRRVYDLC